MSNKQVIEGYDIQRSAWKLFYDVLKKTRWSISPSVTASLASTIEGLYKNSLDDALVLAGDIHDLLEMMYRVNENAKNSVALHLEHASKLLKACLDTYMKYSSERVVMAMALSGCSLYTLNMERFVQGKKVWECIIVRQLYELSFGAFYEDARDRREDVQIRLAIQETCQRILRHALFSADTFSDLVQSVSSKQKDDLDERGSYSAKLIPILQHLAKSTSDKRKYREVEAFLPWLVRSFSEKMVEQRASIPEKFQNADVALFMHVSSMVMNLANNVDAPLFKMQLLASLCKQLKANSLYRPTGSDGELHQTYLLQMISYVFDTAMSAEEPELVSLCLQALDGILVVEHRGIEGRLSDYWASITLGISTNTFQDLENSVALFVEEFGALRRLDKIFFSIGDGLTNPSNQILKFVLSSQRVMNSFKSALNKIPSGQSVRFIDIVSDWIVRMDSGLMVAGVSVCCLILTNIPVDLNNANKVASHLQHGFASLQHNIRKHLDDLDGEMLSSLLVMHAQLLRIYMECLRIDPTIVPLDSRGVTPQFGIKVESNFEYQGIIYLYSPSELSEGTIPVPILLLSQRLATMTGPDVGRYLFSIFATIEVYMEARTEQFQHEEFKIRRDKCGNKHEDIKGLMKIISDVLKWAREKFSNQEGLETPKQVLFHHINAQNALQILLKSIYQNIRWFEVGLECLEERARLKLVKHLFASDLSLYPPTSLCMSFAETIADISRSRILKIQEKMVHSLKYEKKRKLHEGEAEHDYVFSLIPKMLVGHALDRKVSQETFNLASQTIKKREIIVQMKKAFEKCHDDLQDSYHLANFVSKLCYKDAATSQSIRGICMAHIFNGIVEMSITPVTNLRDELRAHLFTALDGLSYQTQLLNVHTCVEDRSKSCRVEHVVGISKLAEMLLNSSIDYVLISKLQRATLEETEMLGNAYELATVMKTIKKDKSLTALTLTRGICRLAQNQMIPSGLINDIYEDMFYQVMKHCKKLCKGAVKDEDFNPMASTLAGTLADALPVLAAKRGGEVHSRITEMIPIVYSTSVNALSRSFTTRIWNPTATLDLCAFIESYTKLSSSTKPRMTWESYTRIFAVLATLLYMCPKGLGQGHLSRPNAPREAMIPTASSFDPPGEARRGILRSVSELLCNSTREECTRILQLLYKCFSTYPARCVTPFVEILLIMLEDDQNGVLKDLLNNQIDGITYSLLQLILLIPFYDSNEEWPSADAFLASISKELQTVRAGGLCPSNEVPSSHIHSPSDDVIIDTTTSYRCIESIVCRPLRFKKFPKRFVGMILSSVHSTGILLSRYTGNYHGLCFSELSSILVGMMRHQIRALSRSLHLTTLAISSLQNSLFMLCVQGSPLPVHVLECFCRVLEEFSRIRAVQPYCKDVILTHIKLFMAPLTVHGIKQSLPQTLCDAVTSNPSYQAIIGTVVVPMESQQLIAPGICALYGTCSETDIQDIFTSLGRQSSWHAALNDLKMVYESQIRYVGKV